METIYTEHLEQTIIEIAILRKDEYVIGSIDIIKPQERSSDLERYNKVVGRYMIMTTNKLFPVGNVYVTEQDVKLHRREKNLNELKIYATS